MAAQTTQTAQTARTDQAAACKVCGGGRLRRFAHTAECGDCGALMYFPYPTTAEVVASGFYTASPETAGESFREWYEAAVPRNHHNFTHMIEFALAGVEVTRPLDLLDYGGGGGQFAAVAASLYPCARTHITDLYDNALLPEWAPFNTQISFAQFPGDPRRFDFIFLNDVYEHVEDPVALLRQLAGKLKPGGRIFIDTPRTFWLHGALRTVAPKLYAKFLWGTVSMGHLQIWSRKALETSAARNGLEVLRYRELSEFTLGADYYTRNMGIQSPLLRAAGRAFYALAPWIARNKIMALLGRAGESAPPAG